MKLDDRLYYGCEMDPDRMGLPRPLREHQPESVFGAERDVVARSKDLLHRIVSDRLTSLPAETRHVVPLSSGLDSRVILEVLLDHVAAENVVAVSYGSPRTWDFELPAGIADAVGVRHHRVDLTGDRIDWSLSALHEHTASVGIYHSVFEGYPNRQLLQQFDDGNSVFWSGYLGMLVGGSLPPTPSRTWDQAKAYFANWCQRCTSPLISDDYDPTAVLPDEPWVDRTVVNFDDQLNLGVRQQCYIRSIVIHDEELFITPFTDPEWMQFWMDVPWEHRSDSSAFKTLAQDVCTTTAGHRTDANYGAPLTWPRYLALARGAGSLAWSRVRASLRNGLEHPDPHENYLNFAAAFRVDRRFRELAREALISLRDRHLFDVDPIEIWEAHQAGDDRSREIELLVSYELAIQALGCDSSHSSAIAG